MIKIYKKKKRCFSTYKRKIKIKKQETINQLTKMINAFDVSKWKN